MKPFVFIFLFFLFVLLMFILVSLTLKDREGLDGSEPGTSIEETARSKANDIKTRLEPDSYQLFLDARKHAESTESSLLQPDAEQYAIDTEQAYQDIIKKHTEANTSYTVHILSKYNVNPESTILQESKETAEESIATITGYMNQAKTFSETARASADGPRPTGPNNTNPSKGTNPPTSMYEDIVEDSTETNAPLNTGDISTSPPSEHSNEHSNEDSNRMSSRTNAPLNTDPQGTPSIWDITENTYRDKLDKRAWNMPNDFSHYASIVTPPPVLTGDTKNDAIVTNKTFIDYLIQLFRTYSEPFKSNYLLTDVSTNVTYDLRDNYELYYKDGELKLGKHDDTDYKGFIERIEDRRRELEEQAAIPCTDTIKCIADFDTNIGDKLCCGQKGVLKNTRYVCPENKPTCGNFKCGTNFGECY